MSILIIGVEMPKGCGTCPYCDRAWNNPKCKAKSVQGRLLECKLNLSRTRQKWCPLVPVLPHDGRLINVRALLDAIESTDRYHQAPNKDMVYGANCAKDQAWYKAQDIYAAVVNAPTVIPAEKGGEEE